MKLETALKRHFGNSNVVDYLDQDTQELHPMLIGYWACDLIEDQAEPDYFVKCFESGLYQVMDIRGRSLFTTMIESSLKKFIKTLVINEDSTNS